MPGIDIGFTTITYYGMIVMSGAMAAAALTAWRARRLGLNPDFVWDGLFWVLIGGVIGARLWHIFTPSQVLIEQGIDTWYYLTHPLAMLDFRNGGLGIPGAVIGGGLALYLYARRRGENFLAWADAVAPGLALAQAIGRWGNYVNQELYGSPTNLPWAIRIDPKYRLPGFETVEYFHPLFLYESLYNLANMLLLLWIERRFKDRLIKGDLFLVYLVMYPLGRFFLEFLRLDTSPIAGLNANQVTMAITALVSFGLLIWRHRQADKNSPLPSN
jgi:phosphatidylglycerol---prolipoprotein diacylglyceryl transferase